MHPVSPPSARPSLATQVLAWWLALLGTTAVPAAELPPAATRPVDFVADIRPIFAEHCLDCHGAEKQQNGYRLDGREIAIRGGDSGHPSLVPGD